MAKVNVLVFGAGQMSQLIPDYFNNVRISKVDIRDEKAVEKEISTIKPEVVINTAAKTNIDWCELNQAEAFEVNTLGAANIWVSCQKQNVFFCHVSSGCIFSSDIYDQIYTEKSTPNPKCYYSWTKVWAENLLGKSPNLLVLRPRVVISSRVSPRNTLCKWMVYSHFISDQNSVTVLEDMFPILRSMIDRRISGTFNIVNKGTISPLEVALLLKKDVNPKMKITETTLKDVNSNLVAKRVTTVLSSNALSTIGYDLPPINESILQSIKLFKSNLAEAGGLKALEKVRSDTKKKYSLVHKKSSTYKNTN